MKTLQPVSDKFAIGLSMICAIHCLVFPLLLISLPGLAALQLDNEAFHLWMVIAVIPVSVYALTLGCKQHNRYRLLALGLVGLGLMLMALMLGEHQIGEVGEKILTLMGAVVIAGVHWVNYRHCQTKKQSGCDCADQNNLDLVIHRNPK